MHLLYFHKAGCGPHIFLFVYYKCIYDLCVLVFACLTFISVFVSESFISTGQLASPHCLCDRTVNTVACSVLESGLL